MTDLTREEWLAERRKRIHASDVPAILGISPHKTALDVYGEKVLGWTNDAAAKHLAFGRDVEGAIANMYAHETGRPIQDIGATTITVHPDIPWLAATLDRVIEGTEENPGPAEGEGVLELKHIGRFDLTPEAWRDEPPIHHQVQAQIQAACADLGWLSLAGMFPGYQLAYKDILRKDDFLDVVYLELDKFWSRVNLKDPPNPKGPNDLDVVKRLYSQTSGETIALDDGDVKLVEIWEAEKEREKEAKKNAKHAEAQLRARMKDNTFGALPDGRFVTLKTTKRKGYTRVVEPSEFRTLRIAKRIGK